MSQIALDQSKQTIQTTASAGAGARWRGLYKAGLAAALVQIGCVLTTMIVVSLLGGEPATVDEYYSVLQEDRLVGILRLDLGSLINVALFSVTSFAAYTALQRDKTYAALATALVFVGVAVAMATHSAASMIHLSDRYAAATSAAQRAQLVAAGEAVMATDWWHSTGGSMAGLFLQGGTVLLSWIMLRSRAFSKGTAYTGMLANGLDFVHVLVGLFAPGVAYVLLALGGLFYLGWYPLLARDFYRLGRAAPL
jgi:hypothetical protein